MRHGSADRSHGRLQAATCLCGFTGARPRLRTHALSAGAVTRRGQSWEIPTWPESLKCLRPGHLKNSALAPDLTNTRVPIAQLGQLPARERHPLAGALCHFRAPFVPLLRRSVTYMTLTPTAENSCKCGRSLRGHALQPARPPRSWPASLRTWHGGKAEAEAEKVHVALPDRRAAAQR